MIFLALSSFVLATCITPVIARCSAPEPLYRICYDEDGATSQNITIKDLRAAANYLRNYGSGRSKPHWTMKVKDADNCGEWQVTKKGSVMVLAKLIGDQDVSVAFSDIAATLDGGTESLAEAQLALTFCGSAGGQMGLVSNATDPYYSSSAYKAAGFVNTGLIIKVVHG